MTVFFKNFADPEIVNENLEVILQFKKNITIPTRERYDILDSKSQSIGKVEKLRNNFGLVNLPRIVIKTASHKIELIKEMKAFRESYEIYSKEFSTKGEWNAPEFTILKNAEPTAIIAKMPDTSENQYKITLLNLDDQQEVFAIVFAVSWVLTNERSVMKMQNKNLHQKLVYPIVLTPASDGYTVYLPDFDKHLESTDLANAMDTAREAITITGLSLEDDAGKELPVPSPINSIEHKDGQIVTLVDVDLVAYRKKYENRIERRNISLPKWLNQLAKENSINVSEVTTEALKKVLNVEE